MANRIIPAADVGKEIWVLFEKIADEEGLDGEDRATVLDQISKGMFYASTFKGLKNG